MDPLGDLQSFCVFGVGIPCLRTKDTKCHKTVIEDIMITKVLAATIRSHPNDCGQQRLRMALLQLIGVQAYIILVVFAHGD